MKPESIELNIRRLVLDGFSKYDPGKIKEAVEIELSRMLKEQELPQLLTQGSEIGYLQGENSDINESRDNEIGAQVARVIYGGLKR